MKLIDKIKNKFSSKDISQTVEVASNSPSVLSQQITIDKIMRFIDDIYVLVEDPEQINEIRSSINNSSNINAIKNGLIDYLKKNVLNYNADNINRVYSNVIGDFYFYLNEAQSLNYRLELVGDKYKLYPSMDDSRYELNDSCKKYADSVLDEIIEKSIITGKPLILSMGSYTDKYMSEIEETKKKVLSRGLLPYPGDFDFLRKRIQFITERVFAVIQSDSVDSPIKSDFVQMYPKLSNLNEIALQINTEPYSHDKYNRLERVYEKVLEIEGKLAIHMNDIWKNYLTDIKDFVPGNPFRFLVHSTNHYANPNNINKLCCTLVTNNCMPIPYGDFGYVVDFDSSCIDTMSMEDAGSWVITEEEFINRGFPSKWQLYNEKDGKFVWYEHSNLSSLILPWEMEQKMIELNNKYHGSALGAKSNTYSEIFMYSGQKPLPIMGFFAKDEKGYQELLNNTNEKPIILDYHDYLSEELDKGNTR